MPASRKVAALAGERALLGHDPRREQFGDLGQATGDGLGDLARRADRVGERLHPS
jgi:hypothetical protein